MNTSKINICRKILYPVGWLYGIGTEIRNSLYEAEVLKSHSYKTAIITVGNITVGGTGKTPFVEYLIRILKGNYKIVELSRGYKRKTKGYLEAGADANAMLIGDESYQIFRKFSDIKVVVDADRCNAIETIEDKYPDTDVFILDDAFQYRRVNSGRSILLIDYNKPITEDSILPYGDLRESAKGRYRADIVVMTKCPANMNAFATREVKKSLNLQAHQNLYFTTFKYAAPRRMSDGKLIELDKVQDVLMVTAIANQVSLEEYVKSKVSNLHQIIYEDHHNYTNGDAQNILSRLNAVSGENKIILTTAKDESKLIGLDLPEELLEKLYVIDVEIEFLFSSKDDFDKKIIGYVEKNKRNSILFTK